MTAQPTDDPAPAGSTDSPAPAPDLDDRTPPASFTTLVTMLASQAMVALGQIPDPVQRKPVVRPKLARHFIDLIAVLEDKTRGNLSHEEAAATEALLHELRVAFVASGKK